MAEAQNRYVVVALGAFWHLGDFIKDKTALEVTRKERINLKAAKSVRDATDEEIKAFREGEPKPASNSQSKAKASTSTKAADGDDGAAGGA